MSLGEGVNFQTIAVDVYKVTLFLHYVFNACSLCQGVPDFIPDILNLSSLCRLHQSGLQSNRIYQFFKGISFWFCPFFFLSFFFFCY